ncbi:hypothetical protein [Granulicella paludicola]|uniref:hypothetical protein n=1 Tax=Granulicella paludicola TaxID=474951 RepID=UPI0021DFC1B6|nr:hypothetical protein [Granulicella paludicola]
MANELAITVPALLGLLAYFQHDRHHDEDHGLKTDEKRKDALQAMQLALATTIKYQEAQPNGVDREKENELADLWRTAAIKSQTYIGEATPWNLEKATYWSNRLKEPDESLRERQLDIASVQKRIDDLILQ